MIVERFTFGIKPGRVGEALKMTEDFFKWVDLPITHRIYQPISGRTNVFVEELEFEDFEQRHKFWTDLGARPE